MTISIEDYDYDLSLELIAQSPAEPRDTSRLLVYDSGTDKVVLDVFSNVAGYLQPGSIMVLNDTKVVPARLELTRPSGGKARILFLFNEWDGGRRIKGLPDKGLEIGEQLSIAGKPVARVLSHEKEEFAFELLIPSHSFEEIRDSAGVTPLPPYIHSNLGERELRDRYQTVFAREAASVAAPTASLHFTGQVFDALSAKGIEIAYATLHVGRGTFSPVSKAQEAAGALHAEPIRIDKNAAKVIAATKKEGRPVIAAGTTSARLLESAAPSILAGDGFDGETSLFIKPPYDFKVVDALITNFHLPKTSLLTLVDAFMQWKGAKKAWRDLYSTAIAERFRFYSFGDAMLIL